MMIFFIWKKGHSGHWNPDPNIFGIHKSADHKKLPDIFIHLFATCRDCWINKYLLGVKILIFCQFFKYPLYFPDKIDLFSDVLSCSSLRRGTGNV